MIRQIIHIDEEKCNGCGLCAHACHEGAIDIIDGKAKLVRENFCDGFGDCLPGCPMGAITFENREAPEYDEKEVLRAKARKADTSNKSQPDISSETGRDVTSAAKPTVSSATKPDVASGRKTSGNLFANLRKKPSDLRRMKEASKNQRNDSAASGDSAASTSGASAASTCTVTAEISASSAVPAVSALSANPINFKYSPETIPASSLQTSQLKNWPPQIKLAPVAADYYDKADLLIAADCTAYSYAAFHKDFMAGCTTLIGCPKLDSIDYSGKLSDIFRQNDINTITVIRMEVPCCGGMSNAVRRAVEASGKKIPMRVITISVDGMIL